MVQKDKLKRGKEYWQLLLEDWKASRLSPTAYVTSKGIKPSAFYRWKALLGFPSNKPRRTNKCLTSKHAQLNVNKPPAFVELNLNLTTPKVLPSHLDIILKNGFQLRLACPEHEIGFNQLIKTLGALS